MTREVYKYQAAGNDFIMIDGRASLGRTADFVDDAFIRRVCDRRYGIGADGLIVLTDSERYDFGMQYYNSDGSGGMMCGNGGRAVVAFAADLGFRSFAFEAADGFHDAELQQDGNIRLKMKDVSEIVRYDGVSFRLDTGTKHFVRFVDALNDYPVVREGRKIRYDEEFAPIGTNVNFVEPENGVVKVRTYEKGVEDETYACGTGIVASCIAAYLHGVVPAAIDKEKGKVCYEVQALHDTLAVDFRTYGGDSGSNTDDFCAKDVWLTGPASKIAKIELYL